jgi:poly-gamma-glutamate capsule biosynthesis protein CapA/YwtB (metallophosphatase superfamily)
MKRWLIAILAGWIAVTLLPFGAQAQTNNPNEYDRALTTANMCGSGAAGEAHFTLAATGDTFPHENIQEAAEKRGYDFLFEQIAPYLKNADIAYTNFDGAMLESAGRSGYPNFNYSPKLATALKNANVKLVSTANNHILDKGPVGVDATLKVLETNGIMQHGAVTQADSAKPRPPYQSFVMQRNGVNLSVGFLSATWGTNGINDPNNQVNLLYTTNNYGQAGEVSPTFLENIAKARRETDIVIVAAHFGFEYNLYPHPSQIEASKKMAAAGADVILGAQAHTLQPVDILNTNGRKTLVIYSLANFLAAQSQNQAQSFSNTAAVFYVGLVKDANGKARVTGYRYLPTQMTNGETQPAPITNDARLVNHVRLKMRDPGGLRQVPAEIPKARIEVCPALNFKETGKSIGGDFAQYFTTLGATDKIRPSRESVALVGYPTTEVKQELSGDCKATTSVLYTERQRLELQPDAAWGFRVVGTQLGTEVYRQKYKPVEIKRLEPTTIKNPRFKKFYDAYGGLPVFGYPLSAEMEETDADTKKVKIVQYFERARMEIVKGAPENPDPLYNVQLGLLSKEYPGIDALCGSGNPAFIATGRGKESDGTSPDGVLIAFALLLVSAVGVIGVAAFWRPRILYGILSRRK